MQLEGEGELLFWWLEGVHPVNLNHFVTLTHVVI